MVKLSHKMMAKSGKKNNKIHVFSISFANELNFSKIKLSKEKYSVNAGSAILIWSRAHDCSDCTTLEDGVCQISLAQMFQIECT